MSDYEGTQSEAGNGHEGSSNSPAPVRQGEEQAHQGVSVQDHGIFFRMLDAILTCFQPYAPSGPRMNVAKELKSLGALEFRGKVEGSLVAADLWLNDVRNLGKIANEYKLWFHIDAAHTGNYCICPEFRHFLNRVELASSLNMNPHKWLKPKQGIDFSKLNRKLLDAINYSGRAFMTQGVVAGIYANRCVVGATLTEERHMNDLWILIQEKAQLVLLQCSQ
ncbi:putative disease resistance protein RGA3-like [Hibiscus syriacus]|uniref:Disease resistance protein RGA3-like n=1 Tax=Hibiscus syriacus TaxID=106335 RepID=A0A6A2X6V7_HIBSY|nr:putative disease resistance protein RGA3-like [Hibiscus syriacus]